MQAEVDKFNKRWAASKDAHPDAKIPLSDAVRDQMLAALDSGVHDDILAEIADDTKKCHPTIMAPIVSEHERSVTNGM